MELTIDRFRRAHEESYQQALAEIRAGRKESHWIWFIFPQIHGLGYSVPAQYYAIQSLEEAEEYWRDPMLSVHMQEILEALLEQQDSIWKIMGGTDAVKLRSSMTLFLLATGENIFRQVLDRFYDGQMDGKTEEILACEG